MSLFTANIPNLLYPSFSFYVLSSASSTSLCSVFACLLLCFHPHCSVMSLFTPNIPSLLYFSSFFMSFSLSSIVYLLISSFCLFSLVFSSPSSCCLTFVFLILPVYSSIFPPLFVMIFSSAAPITYSLMSFFFALFSLVSFHRHCPVVSLFTHNIPSLLYFSSSFSS